MDLKIQIYSFLYSFMFGVIFYFGLDIFNKLINRCNIYLTAFFSFVFILLCSCIYFTFLLFINNGVVHIYFLISILVGYIFVYKVVLSLFTHLRKK